MPPTLRVLCTTLTCTPGPWAIKMSFSSTASPWLWAHGNMVTENLAIWVSRLGSELSILTTQYYFTITDTDTFSIRVNW